jgi:putative transposase
LNIRTPKDTIRIEPNKAFAGRTETGQIRCKHCQGSDLQKWGKSGEKERYRCSSCGHTFCDDSAFIGTRTNARLVSTSLELYFDGLSLAKIVRFLKRSFSIVVCRVTVWKWIQKFVPMVKSLTDKLIPDAISSWHADETIVKVLGGYRFFWDCIDYNTRFIVMTMLTESRSKEDAKRFFKGAKKRVAGKNPHTIVTDGCGAYEKGITHNFWNKVHMGECTYIRMPGLRAHIGVMSNNIIERFHNTLKERAKITRWYKSDSGAENWLSGFVIQYNFLRPHTSLNGNTPAVKAGLDFQIVNGWGDLIQWSIASLSKFTIEALTLNSDQRYKFT